MAASWGGFVFVGNLIAIHAVALFVFGRYDSYVHRAYSLHFLIGTYGAMCVPVINWVPLRSMEHIAMVLAFLGFQVLEVANYYRKKNKLNLYDSFLLLMKITAPCVALLFVFGAYLFSTGYFGPLTARVRGLFVKHTRTGNPLVDSVAEHQPASAQSYQQYLHHVYHIAPWGFALSSMVPSRFSNASLFLTLYGSIAYFFSSKMARLIVLLGPVAGALGGIALGFVLDFLLFDAIGEIFIGRLEDSKKSNADDGSKNSSSSGDSYTEDDNTNTKKGGKKAKSGKKTRGKKTNKSKSGNDKGDAAVALQELEESLWDFLNTKPVLLARVLCCTLLLAVSPRIYNEFFTYSHQMAKQMSHPQIMFKAQLQNGKTIMVDDYREAYWWLRDNTPEDSRVLSWWDYGYQITGVGNRTTLADGNTWNHEHIATIGRILVAPEKTAHRIARHLADYVLIWAGGGGDDLAKSPHMARIGNSVYPELCPGDPTCSHFGFYHGGQPTKMMAKSLLFKLSRHGYTNGVKVSSDRFEHVYTSKYGKVRIFKIKHVSQKSKKWLADPANRKCDAPGSWYCPGDYPPALRKLIARRKLEDFNKKRTEDDKAYEEEYHKRMSGRGGSSQKASNEEQTLQQSIKYIGCLKSEDDLPSDKVYGGGRSGASIEMALNLAQDMGKQYVAVARHAEDGHSFTFDDITSLKGKLMKKGDVGCKTKCADSSSHFCGCSDQRCIERGLTAADGNRRWVVYKVSAKKAKDESQDALGIDDDVELSKEKKSKKKKSSNRKKKKKKKKKKKGKKKNKKKSTHDDDEL
eukprot:g1614.t1